MIITQKFLYKDDPCKKTFTQYETNQFMRFRIIQWSDNKYQVEREYGTLTKKRIPHSFKYEYKRESRWYFCNTDGSIRHDPSTGKFIVGIKAEFETLEEAEKCIYDIEKYPIYH
jgi:hypothetical protein